jgi:hypothetical protein
MFLNPTSGTPAKGSLTTQACIGDYSWGNEKIEYTAGIITYGVTDDIELGWTHNRDRHPKASLNHDWAGPHARFRLLRETRTSPEVSVGGISLRGQLMHQRDDWFLALSKRLSKPTCRRGLRLHLGMKGSSMNGESFRSYFAAKKQPWHRGMSKSHVNVVYGGLEYSLSDAISLITEVSTKGDDHYPKTPWAAGFQYKKPGQNFGCTLSLVQTGYLNTPKVYFGIGINFDG